MAGKGDKLREGADLKKYCENFDKIDWGTKGKRKNSAIIRRAPRKGTSWQDIVNGR